MTDKARIAIVQGDITALDVAISTGVFGYPADAAAVVAVRAVTQALAGGPVPERVILCAFSLRAEALLRAALLAVSAFALLVLAGCSSSSTPLTGPWSTHPTCMVPQLAGADLDDAGSCSSSSKVGWCLVSTSACALQTVYSSQLAAAADTIVTLGCALCGG